mmetsp:Transcript_19969/g.42005  ORF Transcript_19969/g.42005 Transcript_19969/m.42005 type:complete len:123 (+) Transcript_19969:1024-1392(+)
MIWGDLAAALLFLRNNLPSTGHSSRRLSIWGATPFRAYILTTLSFNDMAKRRPSDENIAVVGILQPRLPDLDGGDFIAELDRPLVLLVDCDPIELMELITNFGLEQFRRSHMTTASSSAESI